MRAYHRGVHGPGVSRGSGIRSASPAAAARPAARAARVIAMASVCENRTGRGINSNNKRTSPSLKRMLVNCDYARLMLVNRNYARLWYGQAVSATGDTVFATTLVLWVSQVL